MQNQLMPQVISILKEKDIELDVAQNHVLLALNNLILNIKPNFLDVFKKQQPIGLYIWGGTGRGKSMLMDTCFKVIDVPKERIHYHEFLNEMGKRIAKIGRVENPIEKVCDEWTKDIKFFCFDEFHTHDIAGALLMGQFLKTLVKKKIRVVLTSNYMPQDLLGEDKNIQGRIEFIINLISKHFQTVHLFGNQDYRENRIEMKELNVIGINSENENGLINVVKRLDNTFIYKNDYILVNTRKLAIKGIGDISIWLDFKDVCVGAYSHVDYLNLVKRFDIFVLSNIRQDFLENSDSLRRFIWLIDILYDNHKTLALMSEYNLDLMLKKLIKKDDSNRTLSRIKEMLGEGY